MRNYPAGTDPVQIYYDSYSDRADRRGVSFTLDIDTFAELTSDNCTFCGSAPLTIIVVASVKYYFQALDRIDRSDDYTSKNTIPCCQACSQARGSLTYDAFKVKRKAQLEAYLNS